MSTPEPTVEATATTSPPDDGIVLHPAAARLWGVQAVIGGAVLGLPGTLGLLFAGEPLPAAVVVLGACLLVLLLRRYARAYAARFRCRLLDDGLWVDRGVYWRSETFVPRARVQHTDVSQGPIARRYGIAQLKVFTAGTHAAEIEIDGLAHADALALRDRLLGREGRDGV